MSATGSTFVFEVLNLLLLLVLLGSLFFAPVRAALQKRLDDDRQQREAMAAREEALARGRAALDERRRAMDDGLVQERKAMIAAATRDAAALVEEARETAARERESVGRTLVQLDDAQRQRLGSAIASVAAAAVARLLTDIDGPSLDTLLVQAAARRVETLGGDHLAPVIVESALPLDEAARADLTRALGTALEFRVAPGLGAGVRILTASGLIDASTAGLANEAADVLADELRAAAAGVTP